MLAIAVLSMESYLSGLADKDAATRKGGIVGRQRGYQVSEKILFLLLKPLTRKDPS
jgi:hypothetical protein